VNSPHSTASGLCATHRQQLGTGSAIAPEIIAERGVRTIKRGRELPDCFSPRQRRRGSGTLFTVHRLNGETSYIFRPDAPDLENPGRKYEIPAKKHGGPGNVLDVHPSCRHLIEDTSVPVVFTEGVKKSDSITTAARAAGVDVLVVAISGVWNWLSDGEAIPDMLEIPVEGREVGIVFDSDMLRKPEVQDAARRLAEHLIGRGAYVSITFLPDQADGSKTGADDFLAAGHTLQELRFLTRPYDPADFATVRLSRDERLRLAVDHLWRRWHERDWMRFAGKAERGNWARGHTARDTMEALIELGVSRGKSDARGVVVEVGLRRLAELAAKTAPSVGKGVEHLEADGQLEILHAEDRSKARRYRLLVDSATLYSMERGSTREGFSVEVSPGCKGLRGPTAPRLRWSSPARKGRLIRHREGTTGRMVAEAVVPEIETPYVKRLGPHRGAVVDVLERAGGELHLDDLCEALHRSRLRDVKRRILKTLEEAGIIECEGDVIRLVPDWLAKLEEERVRKGEVEQAESQAEKHKKQRKEYREYLERVKRGTPKASLKAVRRTQALRERRLREIRDQEKRDRAPTPPAIEGLITKIMGQNDRVRMGLLCEIAMNEGLRWRDVSPALRHMGYRIERLPEFGNAEFVFAREAAA
jgi:hypothetical protein